MTVICLIVMMSLGGISNDLFKITIFKLIPFYVHVPPVRREIFNQRIGRTLSIFSKCYPVGFLNGIFRSPPEETTTADFIFGVTTDNFFEVDQVLTFDIFAQCFFMGITLVILGLTFGFILDGARRNHLSIEVFNDFDTSNRITGDVTTDDFDKTFELFQFHVSFILDGSTTFQ
ncbi:hypothetical protein D3C72_1451350 [compost metagenome]